MCSKEDSQSAKFSSPFYGFTSVEINNPSKEDDKTEKYQVFGKKNDLSKINNNENKDSTHFEKTKQSHNKSRNTSSTTHRKMLEIQLEAARKEAKLQEERIMEKNSRKKE